MSRTTRRAVFWGVLWAVVAAAAVAPFWAAADDAGRAEFSATLYADVIRFEADGVASLRVVIYDLSESELWDSTAVAGDTVDWDRTNAVGERLANGYYLYLAQGWDGSGTLILYKAGKVVLLPGDQVRLQAAPVASDDSDNGAWRTGDPIFAPKAYDATNWYVSGNLGVGTDTPSRPLHVLDGSMLLEHTSDTIRQYFYSPARRWMFFASGLDGAFGIYDLDAGARRLAIATSGDFGIGVDAPTRKLDVAGTGRFTGALTVGSYTLPTADGTNGQALCTNGSGSVSWQTVSGGSGYWAASGDDISNSNSGYVGIGSASPGSPLHVVDSTGTAFFEMTITEEGNSDWAGLLISGDGDASTHSLVVLSDQSSPYHSWTLAHKKVPSHNLWFEYNEEGQPSEQVMAVTPDGKVGIGTTSPSAPLTVAGNIVVRNAADSATVVEIGEGLDYAEGFDVSDIGGAPPGTVLVIDADNPGHLTVSRVAYDRKVAGIVAGANALGSGVRLGGEQFDQDVALAGRVYCNVDTSHGAIAPGDLLTTSSTPGFAMKVADYVQAQGAILGKAMEGLGAGQTGQILVLVTLQ